MIGRALHRDELDLVLGLTQRLIEAGCRTLDECQSDPVFGALEPAWQALVLAALRAEDH